MPRLNLVKEPSLNKRYLSRLRFSLLRSCDTLLFIFKIVKYFISNKTCDVLLVNPSYYSWWAPHYRKRKRPFVLHSYFEAPMNLASIAACLIKSSISIRIVDMQPERITNSMLKYLINVLKPKVIGISYITMQADYAYDIGWFIRQKLPFVKIMYGGVHPTLFPKEPFEKGCADFVVIGEGEETIVELCKSIIPGCNDYKHIRGLVYKNGKKKLIKNTARPPIKNINKLPMPLISLLPLKAYNTNLHIYPFYKERALGIMASRGCLNNCVFCAVPQIWKRKLRTTHTNNLAYYIKYIIKEYNIVNFHFYDDNFMADVKFLKEFCDVIKKECIKIRWVCQACICSVLKYKSILSKMRESGCIGLEIGVEFCDNTMLQDLRKKQDVKMIIRADRAIRKEGIVPIYLTMAFCPGENLDKAYSSAQLIKKLFRGEDLEFINWVQRFTSTPMHHGMFFTPVPGSTIFPNAYKRGKIFSKEWGHIFFGRVNFIPFEFLYDTPEKKIIIDKNNFLDKIKDYEPQMLDYLEYACGLLFYTDRFSVYAEYLHDLYEFCDGKLSVEAVAEKSLKFYPRTTLEHAALGIRFLAMIGLIRSKK